MPAVNAPSSIAQSIERLMRDRQAHADAIEAIDSTLARVGAALTTNGRVGRVGRPPGSGRAASAAAGTDADPAKTDGRRRRRTRGRFAMSGEQAVLGFVKAKGTPLGREVEEHWKGEGRAGTAANALSKLVKEKQLKRIPLEGQRGSRYTIA